MYRLKLVQKTNRHVHYRCVRVCFAPEAFAASPTRSVGAAAPRRAKGLNFTHWGCPWRGKGIIATYHLPGVRSTTRALLANKRAQGLSVIRHMLWFTDRPGSRNWGVIPTSLREPYALNLRLFVADVKDAGMQLEIAFGPQYSNSPIDPIYDPTAVERNWAFIVKARDIVESVYPDTRYDLQNEGGAWPGHPLNAYVSTIWDRYEGRYGLADATISFHEGRWRALLTAVEPDPSWYEVHVYPEAGADYDVPPDDKPVSIGEHTYGSDPQIEDPRVFEELYWPSPFFHP